MPSKHAPNQGPLFSLEGAVAQANVVRDGGGGEKGMIEMKNLRMSTTQEFFLRYQLCYYIYMLIHHFL